MYNQKEEYDAGIRIMEIQISHLIFNHGVTESVFRAKNILEKLKEGSAPCVDGMIFELKTFIERHNFKIFNNK